MNIESGIHDLPDGDVKRALLALIQNAGNDLSVAQKNIENWFDDTMDRVTGWYKRRTQVWTVLIALCLTVASNANTLRIVRIIREDAVVRAQLIEGAKNRVSAEQENPSVDVRYENPNEPMKPTRIAPVTKKEKALLESVLGWSGDEAQDKNLWLHRLLGWFLTIVAVSLGAPFWFDTLNKLINVRNAGRKPERAEKEDTKSAPKQAA